MLNRLIVSSATRLSDVEQIKENNENVVTFCLFPSENIVRLKIMFQVHNFCQFQWYPIETRD